jgi:hypothetical protein
VSNSRIGRSVVTADEIVERALASSGSTEADATEWPEGLRVLTAALSEAPPETVEPVIESWVELAATRIRFLAHVREHDSITRERIVAPIFVIGMPRTGTTALVDLLALDPAARTPLQWETAQLLPPPDAATWGSDPRIAATQATFDEMAADPTSYAALGLHTNGALLPAECNSFLALDFWSPNFLAPLPLPAYDEWLRLSSPSRPYLLHHWILRYLQHYGPAGRWTLKSPFHGFALQAILEEYPDARFVQTHRDPAAFVPSLCGLISTIRRELPEGELPLETGRELIRFWGTGMQRCLAARLDPDLDARVVDLSHRELAADPIGTLRHLYDRLGLTVDAEYEQLATRWAAEPSQERSRIRFSLGDFGLDEATVREAFGPYCERFSALF